MVRELMVTAAAVFFALATAAMAEDTAKIGEVKWFDMEGCEFCKHLMKDPHLLDNMTWEHHDISSGALSITTVKPEYKKAYLEAQQGMMELGQRLEKGELKPTEVRMCGHCQAWGMLLAIGAKVEHIQGESAEIVLMTSDDSVLVEKIHDFAQRNRDEMARWEAEEKQEQ
ncbi:MAG: hypothetical protein AB1744_05215 [Candidatus Zixiibacteriota bacterium]